MSGIKPVQAAIVKEDLVTTDPLPRVAPDPDNRTVRIVNGHYFYGFTEAEAVEDMNG